jgi:hypothetical protein
VELSGSKGNTAFAIGTFNKKSGNSENSDSLAVHSSDWLDEAATRREKNQK